MLAKSKLNSIETLISQALNDIEISHKEFITILKEKDKYERVKGILRSESEKKMCLMTTFAKLWDWVVRVKDTSCKATYKIKDVKLLNAFLKIAFQCKCLTDTICFATYKNGITLLKVLKKYWKHRSRSFEY